MPGYSRLCGGVEIGYSDMEQIPQGCVSVTIPGFDVVDIKGFDISLIEDIPRLMTMAYSYAKLYIETEKLHIVSNHKLPYICYMESSDSLCVEIPVWSKKTEDGRDAYTRQYEQGGICMKLPTESQRQDTITGHGLKRSWNSVNI